MESVIKETFRFFAEGYTKEFLIFALILARTGPMVTLTPFFGGRAAPAEVKIGLSVVLTIILWPLARDVITGTLPTNPILFLMLMLKEVLIGFAIGFINQHIFYAVEIAGRIIDTGRGSSMAEVMVPASGTRATPFGDLFFQLMVVMFLALGGHHIFIEAYFYSFASLPVDQGLALGPSMAPFFDFILRTTAEIFVIGVIVSAPALAAILISDVVFGILNRVAPQLNAYFMSMPVKAMAGVIMVLLAMGPLVERMEDFTLWSLERVEQMIDLIVPAERG